ncbi:complement C1q tumor necrosis factor-related protein 4-like [Dreissena polymorpha]|uniref:C1q domain-containing protein n=1 Tax=Dreissena polymorpha TaxID=45954 RepID=A0A9D4C8S8_DREPO|nr:complement C1q tumor necrosis factor-related protein 4-like [Dreissena polymorpha]XP_052248219.1 complement C1q tumor necrosis factor-related protein 4-like [Dreissena polymorpha]KAH3719098.1 hypothetical protein DPMN_061928 [Dreissena polymorpha]
MQSLTTVTLLAMLVCSSNGLLVRSLPVSSQDVIIDDRRGRTIELDAKLRSLEADINKLTSEIGNQKRSNPGSQNLGDTYLPPTGKNAAFSVTLENDQVIATGSAIRFDTVITNVGNHYDLSTGEFTAPQSGTYFFSLNIVCGQHSYMHVAIFRNKIPVFKSLCDDRYGNSHHQSGGTTILQLNKGDKVSVRMTYPLAAESEAFGRGMTSFTGYLMP